MSGITNPAELYFKNGLWAYDPGADSWRRLETTSGAHTLEVKISASSEVHQDTPSDMQVGIHAWTAAGWVKLLADASGFLKVDLAAQDIDIEVKQTTPADLTVGGHGWDGDSWQKLPMVWGYSGRLHEDLSDTKIGDGTFSAASTNVPGGEVHVVQMISLMNVTGARGYTYFRLYSNGNYIQAFAATTPVASVPSILTGEFCLQAGDNIVIAQESCINNDVITAGLWGYKMLVAE